MKKDIWHATKEAVRRMFAKTDVRLSDEEFGAVFQNPLIYLDAAVIESALALANQEMRRREGGDGGSRGRSSQVSRAAQLSLLWGLVLSEPSRWSSF